MSVRYDPDYQGTGQLMRGTEMKRLMNLRALAGADYAREIAPERTGEYRDSIEVDGSLIGGPHKDRAEARVVANSDHAAYVEWQDDYHVLARTAGWLESHNG